MLELTLSPAEETEFYFIVPDRQRQLNIVEDIMRPRIGYENLLIDCHLVTRDALKVYSLHLRHDLSLFHSRLAKNFVCLID